MARKTYKDLMEDAVKLKEKIKLAKEKEAQEIGFYVFNNFKDVDTLDDFKKLHEKLKRQRAEREAQHKIVNGENGHMYQNHQ